MAPDRSYRWFHLDWDAAFNGHAAMRLYRDTVSFGRIHLNSRGRPEEHFHAKFAANSGDLVVASVRQVNLDPQYYDSTEIVVGRLRDDLGGFAGWVQITDDSLPDYCPDLWADVELNAPACEQPLILGPLTPPNDTSDNSLTILSPAVGDTFSSADTIGLQWIVDDPSSVSGWRIDLSFDCGDTWTGLNSGQSFPAQWRSHAVPCSLVAQRAGSLPTGVLIRLHDYFDPDLIGYAGPVWVR